MTHTDRQTHKWKREKTDILYQCEKYTLMFVHSVSMCVLSHTDIQCRTYGGQKTRVPVLTFHLDTGPLVCCSIPQASWPGSKGRGILLSPQNLPLQCCCDRQALPHQLYVDSGDPHSGPHSCTAKALIRHRPPSPRTLF